MLDQVNDLESGVYLNSKGINFLLDKKDELVELCKKHQIEKLYVFGSATEDRFTDESDFDFLIRFKDIPFNQYTDHYFELHEDLEDLLGRKIDLLTEKSIRNRYFKEKVNVSKILLYAA